MRPDALLSACLALLLTAPSLRLVSSNSGSLRPDSNARCVCNFERMNAELKELYRPERNHAEMVFSFVHTLISLNFKLATYFSDFRECVRFWLDKAGQCDATCSCSSGAVCCRDSSMTTLESSVLTLKSQVKHSFTAYSHIPFLNDYQKTTFDILNVFSSAFLEFINSLKQDKARAEGERKHFDAFYKRMHQNRPLEAIFAQTMPMDNASLSIITRTADHYHCDTAKVLPFYLNVYGTVLQYLFMKELHKELAAQPAVTQGTRSDFLREEQAEWKAYLRLADNMTKNIIFCSTKEIYAIRTQEIKEKDMAMRNAAIVFSSFLLILVIIIALIAAFTCKANRERSNDSVMVRDEPVTPSEEFEHRDLLYKRYYETDEMV